MTSDLLIELAWKAILPSALTLLLLLVLKRRSPAEKSWIAHVGVMATLLLPLLVWAGPDWAVRLSAPVERLAPTSWQAEAPPQALDVRSGLATEPADTDESEAGEPVDARTAALIVYFLVGFVLLLLTLAGVTRLIVLRRNARVVTDPQWISALANAQARIGQKRATALLVSSDVASPVSWGVVRPVILLDEQAASSPRHAEAIIAHELAHVAQADWAKLILCRVATALMWFNPLIWILARQCHQLREEAADDAVLKHHVPDHDYVELLIHAARHESRGLLLAAHGVAPGPKSLKMRVARVLDTDSCRRPVAKAWSAPAFVVAILGATCLAAINPVQSAVLMPAGLAASATAQSIDLPKFKAVELTGGGGEVILRHGPSQRVTLLSGSTSITRFEVPPPVVRRVGKTMTHDGGDTLVINACNGDCPRGYRPIIEIFSPYVSGIAASSGGKVIAQGEFPSQSSLGVAAMGGGEIDVRAMAARSVGAHASGGGVIRTRPLAKLGASASAGGQILYSGDPKVGMHVETGGSVTRAN